MDNKQCINECTFSAVRSSGAGGQHVNKVSSKVILSFNIWESTGLSAIEKQTIAKKLHQKIAKEGTLSLSSSESRSQHRNKELVIRRFIQLLNTSLIKPKKRIATKIPNSSKRKRLESKTRRSLIKQSRRTPKDF